jgi:hypothetical protein
MRFTPAITARLADEQAERVRRNHEQRLGEFAALAIGSAQVISDVVLPNSTPVFVAHKLGRAPVFVAISAWRTPTPGVSIVTTGTFLDFGATSQAGAPIDRSKVLQLAQFGFSFTGATSLVIDVMVF